MTFDITNHWNSLFMPPLRLVDPASWVRHIPFAFFLIDLARPRSLVELGVHSGNSFCAFCQAVRYFQVNTLCHGVDTFQGDDQAGRYEDIVYEDIRNHVQYHYQDFAQLMRMTFDEAADCFSEGTVDILHIDGLHTYDAARHDFDKWMPKMSSRGIVLFHDIHVREEDFGVWKVWDEVRNDYPSFGFRHGHGLGVLATGPETPESVLSFMAAVDKDERIERVFLEAGEHLASILQWDEQRQRYARREKELEARISELQGHAVNLEKHCEELKTHCVNIAARRDHLEEQNRELDQSLTDTTAMVSAMRASWSWKLTKPLRFMLGLAR